MINIILYLIVLLLVYAMLSYKNGIYYFANKESVESYAHYKFNNLSRAYNYFEEMYYK